MLYMAASGDGQKKEVFGWIPQPQMWRNQGFDSLRDLVGEAKSTSPIDRASMDPQGEQDMVKQGCCFVLAFPCSVTPRRFKLSGMCIL